MKNLVTDGLGVELNNKVNEMNLIIANHISDKVIDDVIDNLSRTYKVLPQITLIRILFISKMTSGTGR